MWILCCRAVQEGELARLRVTSHGSCLGGEQELRSTWPLQVSEVEHQRRDGRERLHAESFVPSCPVQLRPAAEQLVARTRRFLGAFMLDHFDIMRLLEDAGAGCEIYRLLCFVVPFTSGVHVSYSEY